MLKSLLEHELNNLLKSKRIYTTVIMFLLLFVSIFVVRVIDYQKQVNQYIDDVLQNEEGLRSAENYSFINPRAIQQPIVFSIYNDGFKIPRVLNIQYYEPIIYAESLNEEDNIFFIDNNQLDITFLITFFLSLFILLISYDSVNGEKRVGTLRILMTYPLKRQTFILKKMFGVFFFVAITFTIPYVISFVSIIYMFVNILSINFLLSAFFYWLLTMLFILFFSLLGIFISCCSTNPNRSLVYSLLVWILFRIVLPISWDYIIYPRLYDEQVLHLRTIQGDKQYEKTRVEFDVNPHWSGNFIQYSGEGFYNSWVFAFKETMDGRDQLLRYMYDEVYPLTFEVEQARDDVIRYLINTENVKNWVFFFNPIVLFNNLSMKITGNSRGDYLRFLHSARELRNELVSLGIEEGWLLDYRFNAYVPEKYNVLDYDVLYEQVEGDYERMGEFVHEFIGDDRYEMRLPVFRRYEQPIYSFGEIFERIFVYLVLFVVSIVVLWVMTWRKFLKYDVR
ncbi:MAG: ABC transporter permease [Candidatus Cloacimonetes bacterium]|nr:ABC transporter permease [Candidatus Cloacimonadota bacterium]